jgi:hypothetical protein
MSNTDALRLLHKVFDKLEERGPDAPGHNHSIPGIWDSDNRGKAGKRCEWCATWNEVRTLLAEKEAPPPSEPDETNSGHQAQALRGDEEPPGACRPNGLMFDAFGEPRVRYVRVSFDGAHCVMTPAEADAHMADAKANDDQSSYVLTDVYLSEREAEDLPEFDGF